MDKIIKGFFKLNKVKVFMIIILSIFYVISNMINPILSARLIDSFMSIESINESYKIIFIIALLSICSNIIMYIKDIKKMKAEYELKYYIESIITTSCLETDILDIRKYESSFLANRIDTDTNVISSYLLRNIDSTIYNLCSIILALIVLSQLNILFSIISIISIPIYILLLKAMKEKLYETSEKGKEKRALHLSTITEQIRIIELIKFENLYNESKNRIKNTFDSLYEFAIKVYKYMYIFYSIDGYTTLIIQIVFFIYGVNLVKINQLTVGQFTIVLSYYGIIMNAIRFFLNLGREYADFKTSIDQLNSLINLDKEVDEGIEIEKIESFDIKDLCFNFNDKVQLSYPDIHIERNGIYLMKGDNGSGKSTLIKLIATLYGGYTGLININQISLDSINKKSLRKNHIGFVPQEPVFFSGTVGENVSIILDENLNYLEFIDLLKESKLDKFFYSSNVLNEIDWEKEILNLSVGQRKKISIILVLLQNKRLVFMDEPNASLDNKSCMQLKMFLHKYSNNNIVIIITHDDFYDELAVEMNLNNIVSLN